MLDTQQQSHKAHKIKLCKNNLSKNNNLLFNKWQIVIMDVNYQTNLDTYANDMTDDD